jgi:phage FluMu protein Com
MPIDVQCGKCGSVLKAPDSAAGRRAKCPKCATSMVVPTAAEPNNEFAQLGQPVSSIRGDPSPASNTTQRPWAAFLPMLVASFLGSLCAVLIIWAATYAYAVYSWAKAAEAIRAKLNSGLNPPGVFPSIEQGGGKAVRRLMAPAESAVIREVAVQVTSASLTKVKTRATTSLARDGETTDEHLVIRVRISTESDKRKVDYYTWRGNDRAHLIDDNGNRYSAVAFGYSAKPADGVMYESATKGKAVEDVLVFEKPLPTTNYVDLELSGANVGGDGEIHFRLPKEMWATGK